MIRAISLWQPWATLWVHGEKVCETRSWAPDFRPGEAIAVHAGLKWDSDLAYICTEEPFASVLRKAGYPNGGSLFRGGIVGLVRVEKPVRMTATLIAQTSAQELAFGDWKPGRFAIPSRSAVQLTPIPLRGRQRVWTLPRAIEAQIREQLGKAA